MPSNKVMAKVKVFVHASHADADARDMTLALLTYVPAEKVVQVLM